MEIELDSWNEIKYSIREMDKLLLAYRLGTDFIQRIEQCREKLSDIENKHLNQISEYSRHFFENGQPFNILRQNREIPNIAKLLIQCEQALIALESWAD